MTLTPVRTACLGLALALSIGAVPQGARADMMAACSADIAKFCPDVANGRGRITACLMAYDNDLSAGCRPEVDALAQRSSTNRLIPANARQIFSPSFRADLPASCSADAASLCPGVPQGDGRVFACLYSRQSQVSSTCTSATDVLLGN